MMKNRAEDLFQKLSTELKHGFRPQKLNPEHLYQQTTNFVKGHNFNLLSSFWFEASQHPIFYSEI